jgi:Zn-dependent protease
MTDLPAESLVEAAAGASPVGPPPPPGPPPFSFEAEFQATLERLRHPKARWGTGLILVGSLALFMVLQAGSDGGSLVDLAVLAAVIFVHESGHWLAMRAFGYRDVRMFFIPFFGGGTTGRGSGVAAWKVGVVLLAGPLPGILLGLALSIAAPRDASGLVRDAVTMLLFINALNLLPLAGLDGGRLLELAIFQRGRWLEIAFAVLASLGLVGLAIALEAWPLGAFAFLLLVGLPARWRLIREAHGLRRLGLPWPREVAEADTLAGRELFLAARRLDAFTPQKSQIDSHFEALVERVGRASPSWGQTAGLLLAGFLGFVLTVVGAVALGPGPAKWSGVSDSTGRVSVEMPGVATAADRRSDGPAGTGPSHAVTYDHSPRFFTLIDRPPEADGGRDLETWWQDYLAAVLGEVKGTVLSESAEPFHGRPARSAVVRIGRRELRVVALEHGGRRYLLLAETPEGDETLPRFFDSAVIRDVPPSAAGR